jgi:hypothetical protein
MTAAKAHSVAPHQGLRARFRRRWKEFAAERPGQRFRVAHARHAMVIKDNLAMRLLLPGLAALSLLVGVILLFIPGPGIAFIALAFALMAMESKTLATWLDRAELWFRKKRAG